VSRPSSVVAAFVIAFGMAEGAAAQEMSYGQAEFLNSCAACHGASGEGDGPLVDQLVKRPADLTRLAEKNGGEFPYFKVFSTIDGRFVVPGHGERDMPVWGRQFLDEDAVTYGPNGGEMVTQERIHQLTGYIQTLQK